MKYVEHKIQSIVFHSHLNIVTAGSYDRNSNQVRISTCSVFLVDAIGQKDMR